MGCTYLLLLLPLLCGGLVQKDPRYWLKVQELLEVQEGLCAQVPCTFYHRELQLDKWVSAYWFHERTDLLRDPPVATNNRQQAVRTDTQDRFRLLGDLQALNCSLSISNARRWDQGRYFFKVEQGQVRHSYKDTQLHIKVTALTQKPAIQVFEPLVSGRPGRLICSLPGACQLTWLRFSWAGEMLYPNTTTSQELSLTPGPQDHGRNLSCRATLLRTRETIEKTIQLNVSYAPQNLTTHVSFRASSGLGDQSVQLLCRTDSNPPAELAWLPASPGNVTITQNAATLELHLSEIPEDQEFACQARNYLGSQTVSVRLSGLYTPTTCSCESRGWWPLFLTLIRGTLMGAGFLLTYVLTWVYYSRGLPCILRSRKTGKIPETSCSTGVGALEA